MWMKEGDRSPDWRELRKEWQMSESVSTGSFFKALHRRGKNTATIERKALIESKNGGFF